MVYIKYKNLMGICLSQSFLSISLLRSISIPNTLTILIFPITIMIALILLSKKLLYKLINTIHKYKSESEEVSIWDY